MFIYLHARTLIITLLYQKILSFVTASEFSVLSLVVVAARWAEIAHVLGTQASAATELAVGANAATNASAETTQAATKSAPKTAHATAELAILGNVERA